MLRKFLKDFFNNTLPKKIYKSMSELSDIEITDLLSDVNLEEEDRRIIVREKEYRNCIKESIKNDCKNKI